MTKQANKARKDNASWRQVIDLDEPQGLGHKEGYMIPGIKIMGTHKRFCGKNVFDIEINGNYSGCLYQDYCGTGWEYQPFVGPAKYAGETLKEAKNWLETETRRA